MIRKPAQGNQAGLCQILNSKLEYLDISLHFSSFLYVNLHFSAFLWIALNFSTFLCIYLHYRRPMPFFTLTLYYVVQYSQEFTKWRVEWVHHLRNDNTGWLNNLLSFKSKKTSTTRVRQSTMEVLSLLLLSLAFANNFSRIHGLGFTQDWIRGFTWIMNLPEAHTKTAITIIPHLCLPNNCLAPRRRGRGRAPSRWPWAGWWQGLRRGEKDKMLKKMKFYQMQKMIYVK